MKPHTTTETPNESLPGSTMVTATILPDTPPAPGMAAEPRETILHARTEIGKAVLRSIDEYP